MSDFSERLARELDALADTVKLDAPSGQQTWHTIKHFAAAVRRAAAEPEPVEHWSEWLDWSGGECPLPDDVQVAIEWRGNPSSGASMCAGLWGWCECGGITRFRYRCDEPGGWIKRPEGWVPPESALPMVLRFKGGLEDEFWHIPRLIECVTHIRLLPRKPAAPEMPNGWALDERGSLHSPEYGLFLSARYINAPNFLRAVKAWATYHGVTNDD